MTMGSDLRYRVIDFLEELDSFLDDYADADAEGDPLAYRPNQAMSMQTEAQELREALEELE